MHCNRYLEQKDVAKSALPTCRGPYACVVLNTAGQIIPRRFFTGFYGKFDWMKKENSDGELQCLTELIKVLLFTDKL